MPLPTNKTATSSDQYKTGALQETVNYTWNTADILGRGATATVYFGRQKNTGDVCAVKVFYDREWRQQTSTRQREIETLRSLDHENIVKLQALEIENIICLHENVHFKRRLVVNLFSSPEHEVLKQSTGNHVLVMEYCQGGSVFTMLEMPQYAMGFPEDEFRLFLTHIGSGLNYLRIKGYIHRDIKPGNIMRFISLDGRSLFKLTDFGAARELQDDETFHSIYGTEEYLYPKMYERAVLRLPRPGNTSFNITVDIWSLGVTIYHVCTGYLPFQPFGGRSNAQTMFEITSKKPSGVISGTQKVQNGPITWSKQLPGTCLLSDELQEFIVPLLGGLMEVDPNKMWPFETFFDHVKRLDDMMVIKVFFAGTGQIINLHVERTDTLSRIQEKLAVQTEIPAMDQLLLLGDRDLQDCIDATAPAHTLDRSILKETILLINIASMDDYVLKLKEMPKHPEISGVENLEADAQSTKKANALANLYVLRVSTTLDKQEFLKQTEQGFRKYVKNIVRQFELVLPEIFCTVQETERRLKAFNSNSAILLTLFQTLRSLFDNVVLTGKANTEKMIDVIKQLDENVKDTALTRFFEKIQTRLNEINVYTEVLSRKIDDQEKDRLKMSLGCREDDYCLSRAEHLKNLINNVALTMAKHRKYRDLHTHESFIHKCEKEKLQEYMVNIWSLLKEHCIGNLERMHRNILREMGNLTKHLLRTRKVEQNIFSVKESSAQLSKKLEENELKSSQIISTVSTVLASCISKPVDVSVRQSATLEYSSGVRKRPPGAECHATPEESRVHKPEESLQEKSSFTEGGNVLPPKSNIRSELMSNNPLGGGSNSAPAGTLRSSNENGKQHSQRTHMLSLLTDQLTSLQNDSEELKKLVTENSVMMEKFLNETSSLRIEGSLDSDQRRYTQDDT